MSSFLELDLTSLSIWSISRSKASMALTFRINGVTTQKPSTALRHQISPTCSCVLVLTQQLYGLHSRIIGSFKPSSLRRQFEHWITEPRKKLAESSPCILTKKLSGSTMISCRCSSKNLCGLLLNALLIIRTMLAGLPIQCPGATHVSGGCYVVSSGVSGKSLFENPLKVKIQALFRHNFGIHSVKDSRELRRPGKNRLVDIKLLLLNRTLLPLHLRK
jgi:hypothetical protein